MNKQGQRDKWVLFFAIFPQQQNNEQWQLLITADAIHGSQTTSPIGICYFLRVSFIFVEQINSE